MSGVLLSIGLVLGGLLLAGVGLSADSELLMAAGAGALALAWVGGPLILLIGINGPQ